MKNQVEARKTKNFQIGLEGIVSSHIMLYEACTLAGCIVQNRVVAA